MLFENIVRIHVVSQSIYDAFEDIFRIEEDSAIQDFLIFSNFYFYISKKFIGGREGIWKFIVRIRRKGWCSTFSFLMNSILRIAIDLDWERKFDVFLAQKCNVYNPFPNDKF